MGDLDGDNILPAQLVEMELVTVRIAVLKRRLAVGMEETDFDSRILSGIGQLVFQTTGILALFVALGIIVR